MQQRWDGNFKPTIPKYRDIGIPNFLLPILKQGAYYYANTYKQRFAVLKCK